VPGRLARKAQAYQSSNIQCKTDYIFDATSRFLTQSQLMVQWNPQGKSMSKVSSNESKGENAVTKKSIDNPQAVW
jgi:hypothetical protein